MVATLVRLQQPQKEMESETLMRKSFGMTVVVAAVMVSVLSSCSTRDNASTSAGNAVPESTSRDTVLTSSAPTSSAPTSSAPASSAPATSSDQGCPVTQPALLAALRTNDDVYSRLGRPTESEFGDVVCYEGFASVSFSPVNGQSSQMLFGFDAGSHTWRYLNIGSSNYCAGFMPADVANHFPGCLT
jgi:hypothetical protein